MSEIIYKYLSVERKSYFENGLLRFTQPAELNDPFECFPVYPTIEETITVVQKILDREIEKINQMKASKASKIESKIDITRIYKSEITKIRKNDIDNIRKKFYDRAVETINSKIGIFSLSRRWNSTLMWSHYTNSHRGFCVGFDRNTDFFTKQAPLSDPERIFRQVLYSDNRIKVPVLENKKIDFDVMLTKSLDWKYEEEERILATLNTCQKQIKNQPYDIFLFNVPHSIIKEIIVGANIASDNFNQIKEFCIKNNITLYASKMSETKFDMNRELIISAI